ncbi:hypothetical protein ColTof4_01357 [Colletotrichum tofieldiae]|nr:hypothetical protein ColTof3_08611 [Colletotrichum tofieldiae]GKT68934.1 hypothetical protein ColTof4_01357 [Colletotrichum tofieldiae]GKT96794.1 hypothetical protein Ct61P_14644 [Colletotrichum tofieldiae]
MLGKAGGLRVSLASNVSWEGISIGIVPRPSPPKALLARDKLDEWVARKKLYRNQINTIARHQ